MALPSVAACPGQNIKLGFEAWLKARYCTCPACGTGVPSFVPMLVASVSLLRADAPSPTVRFMYCKGNQGHVGPHLLTPGSGLRSIPILAQHLRSLALIQWGLQSLTGALPQLGVGVDSCPPPEDSARLADKIVSLTLNKRSLGVVMLGCGSLT